MYCYTGVQLYGCTVMYECTCGLQTTIIHRKGVDFFHGCYFPLIHGCGGGGGGGAILTKVLIIDDAALVTVAVAVTVTIVVAVAVSDDCDSHHQKVRRHLTTVILRTIDLDRLSATPTSPFPWPVFLCVSPFPWPLSRVQSPKSHGKFE